LKTLVAAADYCIRETREERDPEIVISPVGGIEQRVRITTTHTGRPYFICPYCKEMPGEVFRRQKLYHVDNLVGCLRCQRLDYLSHLRGNYHRRKKAVPGERKRPGAGLNYQARGRLPLKGIGVSGVSSWGIVWGAIKSATKRGYGLPR